MVGLSFFLSPSSLLRFCCSRRNEYNSCATYYHSKSNFIPNRLQQSLLYIYIHVCLRRCRWHILHHRYTDRAFHSLHIHLVLIPLGVWSKRLLRTKTHSGLALSWISNEFIFIAEQKTEYIPVAPGHSAFTRCVSCCCCMHKVKS